jgi:hypothetical protein
MSARFLAWYAAIVLSIAALLVKSVTVVRGQEVKAWVIFVVLAATAGAFGIIGSLLSWLPEQHWCNQSRRIRLVLSVANVIATLLLVAWVDSVTTR